MTTTTQRSKSSSVEFGPLGGRPLVFVHGWGLSPTAYRGALVALADEGFRVLAPDLSSCGPVWNERACLRTLDAAADALQRPYVLVGHSLGGAMALRHAATHPERIAHLVLVDAAWDLPARSAIGWLMAFRPYALACRGRCLAAFARNALRPRAWANLAASALWTAEVDLSADADACRSLPSTVLWAAADRLIPEASGRSLADRLGAQYRSIPGLDHDWPLRDPLWLAVEVTRATLGVLPRSSPCSSGRSADRFRT